jgi:signal transduction histidine kinase
LSTGNQAATQEILRQASVALGGRPVWLWEVTAPERLEARDSSDPAVAGRAPDVDLYSTIERWNIPTMLGTRWVGGRAWPDGPWVIAPVRANPPAPPPGGRERRSRERMTLELAGLCIGLGERTPRTAVKEVAAALPSSVIHDLSNPLAAARAALQLVIESVGSSADIPTERRIELLDELGLVNDDIERAARVLRATQARPGETPGDLTLV